jgi:lysophospholipase L1-like esterase
LEDIYQEVYKELSENQGSNFYLSLVSGKKATEDIYNNNRDAYYGDPVHPNNEGSKVLFYYIFKHISSSDIYNAVKL